MTSPECPLFLQPRLRLFLSADIVGSTSLKQNSARGSDISYDRMTGPGWFSAIQGFYFEATHAFLNEWSSKRAGSKYPDELYGEAPAFWKSIGDEVLFTKAIADHRQLATTLACWMTAANRMREFLKGENSSLDVKCTAWLAGFPFRNREAVVNRRPRANENQVEDYYVASGILINEFYKDPEKSDLLIDYIGPSIDTGFRLTGFSSHRKMVVSIDLAYVLSMTSFDGEVARINLHYDGSHSLKGVMGSAPYPVFWINMSHNDSLAVKEDKLKVLNVCNKEDVKEYCDAFYEEYDNFVFRPFIADDAGQTLARKPSWYDEYHSALVKNFSDPVDYYQDGGAAAEKDGSENDWDDAVITEVVERLPLGPRVEDDPVFDVGSVVHHKKFGIGEVIEIGGHAAVVKFERAGRKRLLSTFLSSRPIES